MGSGTSRITSIDISPEEVRPLVTPSQKIRMKMLEKRASEAPATPRPSSVEETSPVDTEDDGDDTINETDSQRIRQARVERYLREQHHEFASLISKNRSEVLPQHPQNQAPPNAYQATPKQATPNLPAPNLPTPNPPTPNKKFSGDASWRRIVLELAMARTSEEATSKLNLLMNRASDTVYAYVPFVGSERHTRKVLADYENSALKLETAELLDQLDYESKITLLRQLMVDLGMRADADDIVNFTRGSCVSEDLSMTEKMELLALLSVRLSFIGLKYFVPITKLVYTKFTDNEIVLVNNKNFSRLLTLLLRVMESLEEKFKGHGLGATKPESSSL
ncbi:hypothetical protein JCM33374_g1005 [Metschnikowia sp. JCM 33374]|nr:hypothetical protein JCM33374_g1005 [Metschnikowia sp. JCM 33374]